MALETGFGGLQLPPPPLSSSSSHGMEHCPAPQEEPAPQALPQAPQFASSF